MANNVFPLRMGEVVRAWYLARETGVSAAAVFGTVILERVIDTLMVVVLAMGVVLAGRGGQRRLPRDLCAAAAPARGAAFAGLGLLRFAPEFFLRAAGLVLRPLPGARSRRRALDWLRRFQEGLGALRGGHPPGLDPALLARDLAGGLDAAGDRGLLALDIDFPSRWEEIAAAWAMLAAIGVAVAIPSTPGFIGPFHLAAKVALQRFGVAPETAVACGTADPRRDVGDDHGPRAARAAPALAPASRRSIRRRRRLARHAARVAPGRRASRDGKAPSPERR